MKKNYVIGADIGGSHICAAAVDLERYSIVEHSYVSRHVDNQQSKEGILGDWADVFNQVLNSVHGEVKGIACAIPGPFDYAQGLAKYPEGFKFGALHGLKVEDGLKPLLRSNHPISVKFLNDATSFAVGAVRSNPSLKQKNTLCITLGTGLGAGFVKNGLPIMKGSEVPANGCLWNLSFEEGMADDYFSTRGIVKIYTDLGGDEVLGAKELAERFDQDELVKKTFDAFGKRLAGFLVPHLKTFQAKALILGGNISKAYALFGPSMEESFERQKVQLQISISKMMEREAILGCTCVFDEDFQNTIAKDLPRI